MRIQNDGINKILNIYKNQGNVSKTNKLQKSDKRDELNISNEAHEFQLAMKAVKDQPEIREKKVEELKRQIESGTYSVDAKKIAEKMMNDAFIYKRI